MDPELEEELKRLAGESGAASEVLERLTDSIRAGYPDWNRANGNVKIFGRTVEASTKKAATALDKFKTGLSSSYSDIKSGFKSLGDESQSGAKAIKNITDSLGSAVSGFASQFGVIGGVAGGVVTALTGMTGVALGFVDELSTTTKKLGEAGIALGDTFGTGSGIDEFDALVKDAGLSAGMLNSVIDSSSNSLRLFSGGAANGLRTVAKGFNQLKKANDGQYEQLVKLGYSTEEIMEGMADFGATARLAGQDLNMDQLAEGTSKYLSMQRELTRLTGTEVKDAKAKADALKSDIAYRKMLQEVGGENAKTLELILSNTNEALQPLVKTLLTGGQVTDQQMALLQQALGDDFVNQIKGIGEEARSGLTLDEKAVTEQFKNAQLRALESADAYISQYSSATLQTIMNKGGPFADFLAQLGPVAYNLEKVKSAAQTTSDVTTNVATGMGKIATALPEIEKASIALRSALYTTGSALTATFAPLITGMASTVESGAAKFQDALTKYSSMMNQTALLQKEQVGRGANPKFRIEEEKQAAIDKVTADTLGSIGAEGSMLDSMFTKLGDTISKAITDGFSSAVNEILPGVGASARDQKSLIDQLAAGTSIDELNEKFPEKMDDLITALRDQSREKAIEEGGVTGFLQTLTKYSGLGYTGDAIEDLFGSGRNNFTADEIVKAYNAINGTDIKIQNKAFGDIMDPKPGGHVVRVAEAGEPEAIMPAKRGADGKLGLEVTGTMLDSSRLLQNLVKINEGQASLIAGLNTRIETMNTNFEKLVYEQRAANRLAV